MQTVSTGSSGIRLAELMAALSLATDLGMGYPLEQALCSCVLSVRLGEALGLSDEELREVYYQALLRYIGCNAETHALSALIGDELALRKDISTVDTGQIPEVMALLSRYIREANAGATPEQLARLVAQGLMLAPGFMKESFSSHCEVAQRLAVRLGFEEGIILALGQLYERWDGHGLPRGLHGETIAVAVRVVSLAQDVIAFRRLEGADSAAAAPTPPRWWTCSAPTPKRCARGWTRSRTGRRCWRWPTGRWSRHG
jgi:hypothetical protein